jgi:hypothetical protein
MSPESEAYLRSLDARPEVHKRIERLTRFLDDVVMVSPHDMFVDNSNEDHLRILAFWEWGVATYSVSIRWTYSNVHENQISILPLIGRVVSVSFSDENRWDEKDFLQMTVSVLPDKGFYIRAHGDAREHLKHLFRTYVLPHLPSAFDAAVKAPAEPIEEADDDDDDDDE